MMKSLAALALFAGFALSSAAHAEMELSKYPRVYKGGEGLVIKVVSLKGGGDKKQAVALQQRLAQVDPAAAALQKAGAPHIFVDIDRVKAESLKVSIGYDDGFIGEAQISYAGPGAADRAALAGEIVRERLAITGATFDEIRFDLIGVDSMHSETVSASAPQPRATKRGPMKTSRARSQRIAG